MRQLTKGWAGEQGITFIETVVALGLLSMAGLAFLSGLATISRGSFVADEQSTAESLALSQMEWVKQSAYIIGAITYPAAPMPDSTDYIGYTASITALPLNTPDAGLQKIMVTIERSGREVLRLEAYKADR